MKFDVAIVGAGIIGCASARALAGLGASVVVVDRDPPGSHASFAAAGMLAPQAEADRPDAFLDLLLQSRDLYPALAADLKRETDLDVGYRTDGLIFLATNDTEAAEMKLRHEWQRAAGLEVRVLTPEDLAELEPTLAPPVPGGLFFPRDHQVDNRVLTRALWFSAHQRGALFEIGREVRGIERKAGILRLLLDGEEEIAADRVVVAGGSWSGLISGLPRQLPVTPVYGQLIAIDTAPPIFRHIVVSERGYLVPRADGRLIIGGTVENVGFRKGVTPEGLRDLTNVALQLAPSLPVDRLVSHWSGLRPGTPDKLPIIGPDPLLPELIYATGHYRNGILLAPITAEIVAALATGTACPVDPSPFRANRFD